MNTTVTTTSTPATTAAPSSWTRRRIAVVGIGIAAVLAAGGTGYALQGEHSQAKAAGTVAVSSSVQAVLTHDAAVRADRLLDQTDAVTASTSLQALLTHDAAVRAERRLEQSDAVSGR